MPPLCSVSRPKTADWHPTKATMPTGNCSKEPQDTRAPRLQLDVVPAMNRTQRTLDAPTKPTSSTTSACLGSCHRCHLAFKGDRNPDGISNSITTTFPKDKPKVITAPAPLLQRSSPTRLRERRRRGTRGISQLGTTRLSLTCPRSSRQRARNFEQGHNYLLHDLWNEEKHKVHSHRPQKLHPALVNTRSHQCFCLPPLLDRRAMRKEEKTNERAARQ